MAKTKSIDRELVAHVVKQLLIEIEKPSKAVLGPSEVQRDLDAIDAFVDGLMTSAIPSDSPTPKAVVPSYAPGTRPVSLRIPNRVLNAFRAESLRTGTSYQTLMIRTLAEAVEDIT